MQSSAATMTVSNSSEDGHLHDYCGQMYDTNTYRFWFEGVLVSVISLIGLVGNLLAVVVLSRPKLRDVFHQLLLALAGFDILYIVFGGVNYTFRALDASSDIFTYLFPYLIYPLTHVAMAGTIFMTLAISIERYLGLCHPLLPPHTRKAWFYILPVVVISFSLNAPKFMEVTLEFQDQNGTEVPSYRPSPLRFDENYIRYYIMWTRLFSAGVIPVLLLLYLNTRIIIDLFSTKVKRFGSARRQRKEINLCFILLCIVLIFFCCHAARIILDIIEFSHVEHVIRCQTEYRRPYWPPHYAQVLFHVSHLTMIFNSSVNFIVYCLVGLNFRKELCRTLGLQKYMSVPNDRNTIGMSRRSSGKFEYSTAVTGISSTNNHNGLHQKNSYNMIASLKDQSSQGATTTIDEGKHGIMRVRD